MKKIKLTRIEFPMLGGCTVHFFVESDEPKVEKYFRERFNNPNWKVLGAAYTVGTKDGALIWFREKKIGYVVHEAVHAIMRIFNDLDTPIDRSTEEFFAYMVDYLVTQILK